MTRGASRVRVRLEIERRSRTDKVEAECSARSQRARPPRQGTPAQSCAGSAPPTSGVAPPRSACEAASLARAGLAGWRRTRQTVSVAGSRREAAAVPTGPPPSPPPPESACHRASSTLRASCSTRSRCASPCCATPTRCNSQRGRRRRLPPGGRIRRSVARRHGGGSAFEFGCRAQQKQFGQASPSVPGRHGRARQFSRACGKSASARAPDRPSKMQSSSPSTAGSELPATAPPTIGRGSGARSFITQSSSSSSGSHSSHVALRLPRAEAEAAAADSGGR